MKHIVFEKVRGEVGLFLEANKDLSVIYLSIPEFHFNESLMISKSTLKEIESCLIAKVSYENNLAFRSGFNTVAFVKFRPSVKLKVVEVCIMWGERRIVKSIPLTQMRSVIKIVLGELKKKKEKIS